MPEKFFLFLNTAAARYRFAFGIYCYIYDNMLDKVSKPRVSANTFICLVTQTNTAETTASHLRCILFDDAERIMRIRSVRRPDKAHPYTPANAG